jgi:hypothetical protein
MEDATALCAKRDQLSLCGYHKHTAQTSAELQARIDAALAAHASSPRPAWAWRPAPILLAGGELPETVCSHLGGAGGGAWHILQFLDYFDAYRLRQACSELRDMVRDFQAWKCRTEVRGWSWPLSIPQMAGPGCLPMGSWRSANPQVLLARSGWGFDNDPGRKSLMQDEDLQHLQGLKAVDFTHCDLGGLTEAGFRHLRGLHWLKMWHCQHTDGIPAAAFKHLAGIHSLDLAGFWWGWDTPTANSSSAGEALQHLAGIHTLNLSNNQALTDRDLQSLQGCHTLDIQNCPLLTDACFSSLGSSLHTLDMGVYNECRPALGITGEGFRQLSGLASLSLRGCTQLGDEAFRHLRHLRQLRCLDVSCCPQLTDAALQHLPQLHSLSMKGCSGISGSGFVHLAELRSLDVSGCRQLTDAAFGHLQGRCLRSLDMSRCSQEALGDAALACLGGLQTLVMDDCSQESISDAGLRHLQGILTLHMHSCKQAGITDRAFELLGPQARLWMQEELLRGPCARALWVRSLWN